jgi:putative spermidine/putrescine transport system substrate-binding protein
MKGGASLESLRCLFVSLFDQNFPKERDMNSKWYVVGSMLILVSLVLSACGGGGSGEAGGPLQSIGEGEGELSIVAWAGYVERGETDPNFDWVTQFEAETSCKVTVKTAATSDEMVALMNEGGFDLVTASGDASNRLISGGRVQEINIDLIPSYSKIDPRLQNAPWHTVDTDGDGTAEHYGVPYSSGQNILMYNTDIFGDHPPTSWDVVFEEMTLPDGQSNSGRIQAYDGPSMLPMPPVPDVSPAGTWHHRSVFA